VTGGKKLGVIGGLGPMATAYFMELLTRMSDAKTDQEHMEVIIYSKPSIPDRTGYILGKSEKSPLPDMLSVGEKLRTAGAELLAMPCITAHYFYEELEKRLGVPVINGLSETASYLAGEKKTCVGILATDGTIRSGVLQNMLRERGIRSIVPEENSQKKVMAMVYDEIKAGHRADMEKFEQVSGELFRRGAQVILLACTELSLIKKEHPLPAGYLDILEVMALAAVEKCHRVRVEFRHLITE
jgi:aspartate racemase